jgi:hypothetical protein
MHDLISGVAVVNVRSHVPGVTRIRFLINHCNNGALCDAICKTSSNPLVLLVSFHHGDDRRVLVGPSVWLAYAFGNAEKVPLSCGLVAH